LSAQAHTHTHRHIQTHKYTDTYIQQEKKKKNVNADGEYRSPYKQRKRKHLGKKQATGEGASTQLAPLYGVHN
jgi:hypothetical protein